VYVLSLEKFKPGRLFFESYNIIILMPRSGPLCWSPQRLLAPRRQTNVALLLRAGHKREPRILRLRMPRATIGFSGAISIAPCQVSCVGRWLSKLNATTSKTLYKPLSNMATTTRNPNCNAVNWDGGGGPVLGRGPSTQDGRHHVKTSRGQCRTRATLQWRRQVSSIWAA
jgi:hypothetical protein